MLLLGADLAAGELLQEHRRTIDRSEQLAIERSAACSWCRLSVRMSWMSCRWVSSIGVIRNDG